MAQPAEEQALMEEAYGPSIWESAVHNKVPGSAWEFQIRKQLNDAAYNHLEYVPYCSTMPVQQRCDEPKFISARTATSEAQRSSRPSCQHAATSASMPYSARKAFPKIWTPFGRLFSTCYC